MGKRVAEHQISKDGREDDDDDVEPGVGLKRASDADLAGRKIRGLPKGRGGVAPPAAASTGDSPKKPTFSGFAGFASPTTAPSPAAGVNDSPPKAFAGFSGFGAPATAPKTTPCSAPAFGAPSSGSGFGTTSSSQPSKVSQIFGSTLSSVSNSLASKPDTAQTPPSPPKSTKDSEASKKSSLDYYLSLRGLNHSVIAAIEQTIVSDPFAELPLDSIAKAYAKYRKEIQDKHDKASKPSAPPATLKPEAPKPTPAPPTLFLPTPPTGGFSFGGNPVSAYSIPSLTTTTPGNAFTPFVPPSSTPTATSNTTSENDKKPSGPPALGNGFTPSNLSSQTTFSFGNQTKAPAPSDAPKANMSNPFALIGTASEDKSKGPAAPLFGGFGAKPAVEVKPEADKLKQAPLNAFGGFGGSGTTSFGAKTTVASQPEADAKGKEAFPSLFGNTSSKPPASAPAPSFFSFGKTTTSTPAAPATTTSSEPTPEKRPSLGGGFGFGAATPKTSFSFGTPGANGSIGNPVGFAFGSPPKDPPAPPPSSSSSLNVPAAPFSFAPFSKANSLAPSTGSLDSRDPSPSVQPEPPAEMTADDDVKDVVGEGEANEDVLLNQRGKVYRFVDGKWVDKGIIYFKIKHDRETGKHRVLARNETSGRVVINFNLYAGFKVTTGQPTNTIDFVGNDGPHSATYKARFKTPEQALEVKTKLEEVAAGLS